VGLKEEALQFHQELKGKMETVSKVKVENAHDLSLAYSPGVAAPCLAIKDNPECINNYTFKNNVVAVVTNGTAVLGLGDIGPEAALPVMEGKAILFKNFAGVDAFPVCINSKDPDKVIETVKLIASGFGGVNLEDISGPDCFKIEDTLKEALDIPVMHDDQHGTAIVTAAGMINALKLANKKMDEVKVVVNGAGAAGIAITKLLQQIGVTNLILCDRAGAIYDGRVDRMNEVKLEIAKVTNLQKEKGNISDVLAGADVFLGVSVGNVLTKEDVRKMAKDPIIFAMANPVPEIMPELAKEAGALVIGTGRSDYPNQINNVLAFPGIFRGALDVQATKITDSMKMAAAYGIANLIADDELTSEYVIPSPFDERVGAAVAVAVAKEAIVSGVAKLVRTEEEIRTGLREKLH